MIDKILIKRASNINPIIMEIDYSWRTYHANKIQSIIKLPFDGEYNCKLKNGYVLIDIWCGKLVINKILWDKKLYYIIKPIEVEPFKIYAVYNKSGDFQFFTTEPIAGFHYFGTNNFLEQLCIGELNLVEEIEKNHSFDTLKRCGKKIARSLEIINCYSLGNIKFKTDILDKYPIIDKIKIAREAGNLTSLIYNLIDKELIKEVL